MHKKIAWQNIFKKSFQSASITFASKKVLNDVTDDSTDDIVARVNKEAEVFHPTLYKNHTNPEIK